MPVDGRADSSGPGKCGLFHSTGDGGHETVRLGLDPGQLSLDQFHLGGVGLERAADSINVVAEGFGVGLHRVHDAEERPRLRRLVVLREPLPGGDDDTALITYVVADRGDLTRGDLDHVGPEVVAGNG